MKIFIHWSTFLKRKPAKIPGGDQFGHYYFGGLEGVGKTYSAVMFILRNHEHYSKVYTNGRIIRGLPPGKLVFYTDFKRLCELNPPNCLVLLDDVFEHIDPSRKAAPQWFFRFCWLNRRKHRCLLTTGQSWLDTPIWFRRNVKFMYDLTRFFRVWIFARVGNAQRMQFDKETGEYVCPTYAYTLEKQTKQNAAHYDTLAYENSNSTSMVKTQADLPPRASAGQSSVLRKIQTFFSNLGRGEKPKTVSN